MTIFQQGATIVPDIVTEAEEARILLRIAQAPWMTDLSRRVQHYGYRYDYGARSAGRHDPAAPFPRWAAVIGERLRPFDDPATYGVHLDRMEGARQRLRDAVSRMEGFSVEGRSRSRSRDRGPTQSL
ncbi:MAG: hypothetical protein OXN81_06975 [Alphaproteobacteria bacterium]|nr:hypothetical protein [Alphaproteobacteria bacterium]